MTVKHLLLVASFVILFAACSDDDDPAPGTTDKHIVGQDAEQYTEASESANNTSANAENTAYVLDTEGIVISGSFEASSPSTDNYKFNTATFSRVSVQVFVNNAAETEEAHKTTIALDSFVNDGLSSLTGSGYFIRASVTPAKDFVISIFTSNAAAAGMSYKIEMKAEN
jgi:hypothetical protein